ncbi:MAG TPA: PAC2 family protein [Chloroflexota bacterium]|nr:PAC2 family protein [Chloroflexota bacterium]
MVDLDRVARLLDDLDRQALREPYVVAGFSGWIDAGSASSGAIDHLVRQLGAKCMAELDPEWFYTFTDTRPRTRPAEGQQRENIWPRAEVSVVRLPESARRDLILFSAPEPNLRWRTFAETLVQLFQRLGAVSLLSLGAVLAPVHHRVPVRLRGWGTTGEFRTALRQRRIAWSDYEGPTGIATVLHAIAQERGLGGAGLTALTPSYLPGVMHPWTVVALLRAVADLSGLVLPLDTLDEAGRALEAQIDQFLAERPTLRQEIEALGDPDLGSTTGSEPPTREADEPAELPSPQAVLEDLEEFLRGLRRGGNGGEEQTR